MKITFKNPTLEATKKIVKPNIVIKVPNIIFLNSFFLTLLTSPISPQIYYMNIVQLCQ